jgi:hypothetical protein
MRQRHQIIGICAFQVVSLMLSYPSCAAEQRWEDPSCQAVVRAFKGTMNYPYYSWERRLVKADGTDRPFVQAIITPTAVREKRSFEMDWRLVERSYAADGPAWDRYKPIYTDCRRVMSAANSKPNIEQYRVRFSAFPYRANMDIWIARENRLLMRHVRTFLDDRWAFPEQRVSTTFAYEDLEATQTAESEATSDYSTSCKQVKQMLVRFNSTEPVKADIREMHLAVAEFSTSSVVNMDGKQYTQKADRPWYVASRQRAATKEIGGCARYDDQSLNGTTTTVYEYRVVNGEKGAERVLSWVSKETGLPIREYFITVEPDNGEERLVSYSYDPELKNPE